ncbi:deoxyribonuclease IV [Cohnella zeiphila]|uniref:Deoxyribonuclease IV n=1 Tax=Cohnella zeiphila TaxID=2761120 RepID=A0A7X0VTV9_9BACL|nr:deoxyribonuclease IV [Cohnella zeiphila]MBB6730344.1 deoxyribonuclease IV [Cohnella zeiphila]
MKIGCHVSTRKGYEGAAREAVRLGGNAFQYFPKNPRSLRLKSFDAADAARCADWCLRNGVVSVAHGPYPVNPAAEGEIADAMAACTLNDLAIAEACGSLGVVVHFGHDRGSDPLEAYRRIIGWMDRVLADWDGEAKLLLENMAGDHGPMGTTPEELTSIRSLCAKPGSVGFVLDTCHLFASGQWSGGDWDDFRERADRLRFWDGLTAVHLNDSRYPSGSRKDRHARIGEGHIGADGFRRLLSTPELRESPLLLETPVGTDGTHAGQLALLRDWIGEEEFA